MSSVVGCLKAGILLTVVSCSGGHLLGGRVFSAETAPRAACVASAYHEFDFWVGDWDAFEVAGTTPVARVRVDLILDGCVLREDYQGTDGHKGQSFSIYDASRKVWHQSWVTNRGELLIIEGNRQGGEMVLSGADHTVSGAERHVRGTWKPEDGGVRETAVTSTDGGKTWNQWFDLMFRKHKPDSRRLEFCPQPEGGVSR